MPGTIHITRRNLLAALPVAGIVVAQPRCVASDAEAAARPSKASSELEALIEAHWAAYRHFVGRAIHLRCRQAGLPMAKSCRGKGAAGQLRLSGRHTGRAPPRNVHDLLAVWKQCEPDSPEHKTRPSCG